MPWLSARLRAPDGCPWDREQTHLTLAKHLIEEAWELHDAIEAQAAEPSATSDAALAEELGDVYLQVILHAQLAAERGAFDLTDVQERLAKKIVRRHPHVFGDATAVFELHPNTYDRSEPLVTQAPELFRFELVRYTRDSDASKALNTMCSTPAMHPRCVGCVIYSSRSILTRIIPRRRY